MALPEMFSPAFGNRPTELVGRDAILSDFITGLKGSPGNRNRAALIIGQRGMGKTAIILEIAEIAETMGFVAASALANERMLDEILQLIQLGGAKYVKKDNRKVTGVNVGALGFSVGLSFSEEVEANYGFRVKLSLLCDALEKQGKGIVILVDEIQHTSPEMRELAATYQHLVGAKKNIAIAMAGLPSSISEVLNDEVLTFLNRAYKAELEPLPLSEISVYYASVFSELKKSISAPLLQEAVKATRGYPYLLQLIGYYLLSYTGTKTAITGETVKLAIGSAKHDLIANVYKPALKPLSRMDIDFLAAMSEDDEYSAIADVKNRMGASAATVQQYRARLIEAGVVAPVKRGELTYTIPYMKDYFRGEL
jgi:hypothetical protein